jgi:MFS transporter, ACS family, solute carrier family 17 (sodium-dependent inorganic phosphate cotransporter), other
MWWCHREYSTWHRTLLQAKPAKAASRWQRRYTIVALCFVAFMLCNMDRVNMSIAILPMAKQYAWDSQTIGLVQSSFFWCGPD